MFFKVLNMCPVHFYCARCMSVVICKSDITLLYASYRINVFFLAHLQNKNIHLQKGSIRIVSYISVTCQMSTVTGH